MNIEVAQKKNRKEFTEEDTTTEDSSTLQSNKSEIEKCKQSNGITQQLKKNGYINQNDNALISRDGNLILVPEPLMNHQGGGAPMEKSPDSGDTKNNNGVKVNYYLC